MNSVAGPKELMKNHSLSQTNVFSVYYDFYQTSLLVCFKGFVCFKLVGKAALSYLVYASQHWSPAIGLSRRRSRWLWCVLSNHIPSSLPLFKQLVNCTVALQIHDATFQCNIICGSELYLSIFLSRGSIALYICMCCFFCQIVHLNYIVHMQMIWTLCYRIYCLFCTWWLICTPTSPAPPPQLILWWFYVMMTWTYQMN